MIKEDMKKLINKKEKLESTGLKKSINIYQKVFKIDKKLQRTFAVFVKRKGVWHNKSTRKSNKINNITKKYTGTQIPTKRASGKRYPHISYVNNKANKQISRLDSLDETWESANQSLRTKPTKQSSEHPWSMPQQNGIRTRTQNCTLTPSKFCREGQLDSSSTTTPLEPSPTSYNNNIGKPCN